MYKFDEANHLHTLDGKPLVGCSTALKVLSKPLTWWSAGLALTPLGWSPINDKTTKRKFPKEVRLEQARSGLEKVKKLDLDGYLALLDEGYYAHSKTLKKKAGEGQDAHELAELWVKSIIAGKPIEPDPQIAGLVDWCAKNVRKFLWAEIHLFSKELFTGGICDMGYIDNNGNFGVADYKNRDATYPSDFFQCGGYDLMLTENKAGYDANGNQMFTLDQPISFHAVFPLKNINNMSISFDVNTDREVFKAALTIHKAITRLEK